MILLNCNVTVGVAQVNNTKSPVPHFQIFSDTCHDIDNVSTHL